VAIAQVLKDEGYIDGFKVSTEGGKVRVVDRVEVLRWSPGD